MRNSYGYIPKLIILIYMRGLYGIKTAIFIVELCNLYAWIK